MHPFTNRPADSVGSLGESKLIAEIRRWLGKANPPSPRGIGDDCAVFAPSLHRQVVTVDPVVFGRHFDDAVAPRNVGAKLLKRNLSDIAAMGAIPTVAVVSLLLDPSVKREWLRQFYLGLAATARTFHVQIVGGDVAQAPGILAASLTQLGRATASRIVTREGAKQGDAIYVTGRLGGSRSAHHYRFTPRLKEGQWLAAREEVHSMMDVSDGLAKDIHSITPTRLRASVLATAIPISAAAKSVATKTKRSPLDHALTDGEDYELLFTVSRKTDFAAFERTWRGTFRTPLTRIGQMVTNKSVSSDDDVNWGRYQGYEHLR